MIVGGKVQLHIGDKVYNGKILVPDKVLEKYGRKVSLIIEFTDVTLDGDGTKKLTIQWPKELYQYVINPTNLLFEIDGKAIIHYGLFTKNLADKKQTEHIISLPSHIEQFRIYLFDIDLYRGINISPFASTCFISGTKFLKFTMFPLILPSIHISKIDRSIHWKLYSFPFSILSTYSHTMSYILNWLVDIYNSFTYEQIIGLGEYISICIPRSINMPIRLIPKMYTSGFNFMFTLTFDRHCKLTELKKQVRIFQILQSKSNEFVLPFPTKRIQYDTDDMFFWNLIRYDGCIFDNFFSPDSIIQTKNLV